MEKMNVPHLSDLELKIVQLTCNGYTPEEIVEETPLSMSAISVLYRNIRSKYNIETNATIPIAAVRCGHVSV